MVNQLFNSDLVQSIAGKMPEALKYAYNKYASEVEQGTTDLEKLSDFLFREAERAVAGGIFDLRPNDLTSDPKSGKKVARFGRSDHVLTTTAESHRGSDFSSGRQDKVACAICNRNNHSIENCNSFKKETIDRRWFLVKKFRLCFKCLESDHSQVDCKRGNCSKCERPHNFLLHNFSRDANRANSGKKPSVELHGQVRNQPNASVMSANSNS